MQRVLGRDEEFWDLLEQSARLGMDCVEALKNALHQPDRKLSLETFAAMRRENKKIVDDFGELLASALVVSMEREDLEALCEAFYKIPKTVEKFAERYILSYDRVQGFDFTRQLILMEESVKSVFEMVQAFRAGAGLGEIQRLDQRVQRLENEADDVVLRFLEQVYQPDQPTLRGIILKDLFELNEKVVDRCRDVSSVLARTFIKHS